MNKDKLLELKAIAESTFESIVAEVKQLEAAVVEKNTEATKLQGDFRTLEKLIQDWVDPSSDGSATEIEIPMPPETNDKPEEEMDSFPQPTESETPDGQ